MISFIIVSKSIKYLRINLSKKVQDLYTEDWKKNFKILLKEIKEDPNTQHLMFRD